MPARNAIRQGAGEHCRKGRCAQKDGDPDPDFMPQVEEAEQIRYARPEACLEDSQEEAEGHHSGPVDCGGLTGGADAPAEDCEGEPSVRGDDFPH